MTVCTRVDRASTCTRVRSTARATSILLSLACLVAACTTTDRPAATPPASGPVRGGVLVAALRSEPRTFNRLVARDYSSALISDLIHAPLVRIDRETDLVKPWLAENWDQVDEVTFRFRLREGVAFSDGQLMTSADVVFSLLAAYDPRVASPLADALRVQGQPLGVEAPDPHTVVIRFPAPYSPGVRMLAALPVLPKHRLAAPLDAGTFGSAWGVTEDLPAIVGLGPFVLEAYAPGQRLELTRNPHYWRADEEGAPLPRLDGIRLEIVPDQNAELLRLDAGGLDVMQRELRAEDVAAVRRAAAEGHLQLYDLGVGLDADFLFFNLKPEALAANPRGAWLQHEAFRLAISHAVDRQSFAETVYLGLGEPIAGPVTPGNRRWFAGQVATPEFDPARARRLLAGLGFADADGDGVLTDPGGRPARFTLLTQRGNTVRERAAAVLQADLARVGLVVDVAPLEFGALIERVTGMAFEAAYLGFLASDTDPAVNLDFWLSSASFHVWNPAQPQPATEWEHRIDQLMRAQLGTFDEAERKRLFDEVQELFVRHQPAIYFAAPRVFVATSSRAREIRPALLQPQVLWNADELWLAR